MRNWVLLFVSLWGSAVFAASTSNLNKSGVILDGYDAVSYFKGSTPLKGKSQFQTKVGDDTYWFANQENKDAFVKEPNRYEPQFGGWCAYAIADSKDKVDIDPEKFLIQDGRLLVFYAGWLGDTKKKWLSTKNKDPKDYLKQADANWPQVKPKDP